MKLPMAIVKMSDDLKRKLAALTADNVFEKGSLNLGPTEDPAIMAALLGALDNTMMPRHLRFGVGETSVTLHVSGRRLRAMVDIQGIPDVVPDLTGKALSIDEKDDLTRLGDVLVRLVETPGTLTVIGEPASEGTGSEAGVSVSALAELWEVSLDAQLMSVSERFAYQLQDVILAGGEIDESTVINVAGDPEFVDALQTIDLDDIATFREKYAAIGGERGDHDLVTLPGKLPGDALLSFVSLNETNMLVATAPNSLPQVSRAWASATGFVS